MTGPSAAGEAETYLYKLEAVLSRQRFFTLVVVASSEEKAFLHAENNLLRHTVVPPQIEKLSIVEKKPIRSGAGYVIESPGFSYGE